MSAWESQMGAVVRSLDALSRVRSSLAPAVAKVVQKEIDRGFREQRDPYGKKWAAHKPGTVRAWGAHKILILSGAGRRSTKVTPKRGAGVHVYVDSIGLAISQVGRGKIQARRMILPNGPLPKIWREALEKALKSKISEVLSAK